MTAGIPEIDPEKCTGCGDCVDECAQGAVALVEGKATVVRPDDCDYCTDCETLCSSGAIQCPFEIIIVSNNAEKSAA